MQESFWEPSFKQVLKRLFVSWRKSSCRGCGPCGVHPSAGEIAYIRMNFMLPIISTSVFHVTFSLLCREKHSFKSSVLKNLFPVYSPGTRCSAFGMTQASEQNVRCFSTSGFSHQCSLLQGRVLVWRAQPAKEWPAGWKKCLEQRTRDKNPSWASAVKS